MNTWNVVSSSAEQTQKLGEFIGRICPDSMAILLEGDLGSGKTCFVQGLARGLGVPPATAVNSPTYTLMNLYNGRCRVAHFDLYRLGNVDEFIELDFESYLHGEGVTIVEWAGLVSREGVRGISAHLDYGAKENERTFRFMALDTAGEAMLKQLAETWKES